jgi:plasmid stabilization system protein ParE
MAQRNVRFHPQAEEEVQRAYAWYRERNPTAARAFLADLDHAILRVTEAPERWPLYQGRARRYLFQRFPFSVIYRVTNETIDVIAVAHHRRRPGYWSDR